MTADPSAAQAPRSNPGQALTTVELTWFEGRIEHWIRFGKPTLETILDRRRRALTFTPDTLFAFVRWASNDFGTVVSRIDIVRAVASGQYYQTLPFVRPGGEILLRAQGWPIDAVEALGIDPAVAAPEYWRHLHNRLITNTQHRPYSRQQHRAWRLRKETT
jgi:hypothetical protein